ncbi:SMI1/KNR4 family protein [Paenibacillus sp. MBLB4367]|uniref:SMI1/KNR4 family protein n=1 Tax=Paenibacillus sp. MBLB4367 TaxID=3384767 RepID=UPI003908425A
MSNRYVEKLIQNYGEQGFFTGGTTNEEIMEIERVLNTKLPESYKWFVMNYGYGGISGRCIEGVAKSGRLTVVDETLQHREYGLPQQFVVIESCDEYVSCLDLSTIKNGDCKVVSWSQHDEDGIVPQTSSFYDYLLYVFYNEDGMDDDQLYKEWLRIFDEMK